MQIFRQYMKKMSREISNGMRRYLIWRFWLQMPFNSVTLTLAGPSIHAHFHCGLVETPSNLLK